MKVLHIGEYVVGGVATYLNELAAYQSQFFDVYLMMSDYNSASDFDLDPDHILRYEYRRHPKYFLSAMNCIRKAIQRIQPDIIHIHSSFAGMLARSLFFVFPPKASVFYCSHGWSFLMDTKPRLKKAYYMIEKMLEFKTDFIINISKYELEQSVRLGMSSTKSRFVYSGLRERNSRPPSESNTSVLLDPVKGDNVIRLLFVGRYDRQKGLDVLLDVLAQYPDLQDLTQLYVIGDSVLEKNEWTFPENVVRLGWVDNASIDLYYQQCDAVIMPSRWEGLPLVALEAMKNRKAVISSSRASLPELVSHEVNGYIFDLDQPEELVHILRRLNKKKLTEMGEIGRSIFVEKFSADRMNEEFVSLYYEARNVNVTLQHGTLTSRSENYNRNGESPKHEYDIH
ncbi:glycosyltransferase [Paenibacillus sp. AN1007]|uniref:Glycosyltransferase n=1 Tax=Paenibacillus sp. AN1007 TaxID=3151385 RepID=A0AAU8N9Z0_9BACL